MNAKAPFALYEALRNVNVEPDKAKAVVEALETDMETHLATKQDITLVTKEIALVESRILSRMYQAMLVQGFTIIGAIIAVLKIFG
ncbi:MULTISPECIES: hypothetical protein [Alloalcanivorax]|jgi:hypothetical protein|uniref:DUF1640 domain-containing protein n=2 Tax=Alloalcanivorax TaxID=3020832 RepID=K0CFM3_ALCDB|nr:MULTISPECIES: hypothetical protein [Alloalcanivorax]ERS13886.1 hypothetical protein Q668_12525 [Alcanivorax sp. PN-3]AFT70411.1 hypothetical protein B5T_02137 [Alloalcanivorax dieselolei B5]ARB45745.1 hypothetical protein P40_10250 [Alloalcanivorax xenomutans]MCE7509175.1 hypothetical protein [Alloalcanivorax xenomutans]WOA33479.1 hypothetical protein RVY87_10435 [Alloalcanivorax xenomutans]|tara:strand:- start:2978 stop:3235 length:258 start_codon:yes stop_codon:yes gene_type:complete